MITIEKKDNDEIIISFNKQGGDKLINILQIDFGIRKQVLVYEKHSCEKRESRNRDYIDFYQDANHECFIFSKSISEIRNLQKQKVKEAGKQYLGMCYDCDKMIVVIGKNDIYIVSEEEYERIKPSLQPHPYDPSLCKPKPGNY